VAAVCTFVFIVGPFSATSATEKLAGAAMAAGMVTLPYGLLYLAHRLSHDFAGLATVAIAAVVAALIGEFVYFASFLPNDGEYVFAYVLVPLLQSPLVLVALGTVLWRRRKKGGESAI
jgi:hypothetical protein